jgi:hypothetical protein
MAIRPDCILRPSSPVSRDFVPAQGTPYRVKDNDSWRTVAQKNGLDEWQLVRFNYPNLPADKQSAARQVNWYLQEYVGCRLLTADSNNYRFSASATPGIIYLPSTSGDAVCDNPESFDNGGQCLVGGVSPYLSGPLLTSIKDRRESILMNTPGRFQVADSPGVTAKPNPLYSLNDLEETTGNLINIDRAALRYDLDPEFVRAIVWMESTHGWYDRFDRNNKTIRPMNVHAKLWEQLGISRTDLDDAQLNIEAGVYILAQIWERTENPTCEKVATLYNQLGATAVNQYGKTIVAYMKLRPWASKLGPTKRVNPKENSLQLKRWKNQ